MLQRLPIFAIGLLAAGLLLAGAAFGQNDAPPVFALLQTIGQPRPFGRLYEPRYDQFALVNNLGELVLADAATLTTRAMLYDNSAYNEYRFSPDGRHLAVALERRVDIWDTQSGTLNVSFAPDGTLGVEGPLWFSDDGTLLVFNSRVPAPQSIRRSENDTVLVPWVWDVRDARDEGRSTLPNLVQALPFFDYRNGLILGAGNQYIAGLPGRLNILNVDTDGIRIVQTIDDPNRLEIDPIDAWRSASSGDLYVRPRSGGLVWINPADGTPIALPLGRSVSASAYPAFSAYRFAPVAQIIGVPGTPQTTSLAQALLGPDYPATYQYHPLTIMLLDMLEPLTPTAGQSGLLVLVRDDLTQSAVIDFLRPQDAMQMALHPDGTRLALRRASGTQQIDEYDIASGTLLRNYYPFYFDDDGSTPLAYTADGGTLVGDFERWDTTTGQNTALDPRYFNGYQSFYFSSDSRHLLMARGSAIWTWDIETGALLRREFPNTRGELLRVADDGQRYLTRIETPAGIGVEIVDVGMDEWQTLLFETLPGRSIAQIVPSDDWQHYIVVYTPYEYSPHYPGYEMALYSLGLGKRWFLAGADVPFPLETSRFGWLDQATAYIYSDSGVDNNSIPQRIYGVGYAPSGIPACLQPLDRAGAWTLLWERLNVWLRADALHRTGREVCALLAAGGGEAEIAAYFTPAPTPTVIFPTPRPIIIPGVPACLTERFPGEALQYAENWRSITAGLSAGQVDELARLVCEGLTGSGSPDRFSRFSSATRVMTIALATGERHLLAELPRIPTPEQPNLQLLLDAFRAQFRRFPEDARLSPDGTLLAVADFPLIRLYRVVDGYAALAATATATAQPPEPARLLALLPTATPLPAFLGQPQPTLTPTMTPTPPPLPAQVFPLAAAEDVVELCPATTFAALADPPEGFAPPGALVGRLYEPARQFLHRLNPRTGEAWLDERLVNLEACYDCVVASNGAWVLRVEGDVRVQRITGEEVVRLFRAEENAANPYSIYWVAPNVLEWEYQTYEPAVSSELVTRRQRYDVASGLLNAPFALPTPVTINELQIEIISEQPIARRFMVARRAFQGAASTGYRYFIVDTQTGAPQYFARLVDTATSVYFEWHPAGLYLYYQYSDAPTWYVFDPATQQHSILGEYPDGQWSPDGRAKLRFYSEPDAAKREARQEAGLPLPTLALWDSTSGQTRVYCVPEAGWSFSGAGLYWSPDSRYVAFQLEPPVPPGAEVSRAATVILDTATGYFVTYGALLRTLNGWIATEEVAP